MAALRTGEQELRWIGTLLTVQAMVLHTPRIGLTRLSGIKVPPITDERLSQACNSLPTFS